MLTQVPATGLSADEAEASGFSDQLGHDSLPTSSIQHTDDAVSHPTAPFDMQSDNDEEELYVIPNTFASDEINMLTGETNEPESASTSSHAPDGTPGGSPERHPSHRPPPPPPRRRDPAMQQDEQGLALPQPPPPPPLTVPVGSMKGLMQGLDRVVEKRRLLRASGAVISRFLVRHLVARIRMRKLRAVLIIQRMWAKMKTNFYRKRLYSFTMGGRWSVETSCLVLALVLGARVRWCFRNPTVRSAIASVKQLENVARDSADLPSAFVLTVQKQLRALKDRVYSVFFDDALFVSFPAPGYFVLCRNRKVACKRLMLVASKLHSSSPVLHEASSVIDAPHPPTAAPTQAVPAPICPSPAAFTAGSPTTDSTIPGGSPGPEPDSLRSAGHLADSVRQKLRSLGSYCDKRNEENNIPTYSDNILESTPIDNPKEPIRTDPSLYRMRSSSPKLPAAYGSNASKRHITSSNNPPRTPDVSEPLSKPQHKSAKPKPVDRSPHVDIHVVAGSKLAPASKSKILRDDSGFPIADRLPTLKITMSVPRAPGSLEMKEVYKYRYDFQERSLNPHWNHFFRLPLPTMDNAFVGLLDSAAADASSASPSLSSLSRRNTPLDSPDSQQRHKYDMDLISHRRWWSAGLVRIEVVDGDRFNDDIFMGEMTILLSSLLGPRKEVISEWSTAKEFQLQKRNPTDRVSGSVSVRMKVEIPTFDALCHSASSASQRTKPSAKVVNKSYTSDDASPLSKIITVSSDSDSVYSSAEASLLSTSMEKMNVVTPILGGKLSARISQLKKRGAEPAVELREPPLVPVVRSSRVIRPRDAPSDGSDARDGSGGRAAGPEGRPRSSPESLKEYHAAARSRVTQQLQGLEAMLSQPTDMMPSYLRKKEA